MSTDILKHISRCAEDYTKNQRLIAQYLVDHHDEVCFLGISELAQKINVSEATIVRFAQKLGFGGYPELKLNLQSMVKQQVASSKKIEGTLNELGESGSVLQQLVGTQIAMLQELMVNLSDRDLAECSEWINKARKVFVYGEGAAATPCVVLNFWLNRIGLDVCSFHDTGRSLFDRIVNITGEDTIVIFGFRRQREEVSILLESARKKQARTILITDVPFTPMASLAQQVLVVRRGSHSTFRSMAVPVAIADALVVSVARLRGQQALEAVKDLDLLRQEYGYE